MTGTARSPRLQALPRTTAASQNRRWHCSRARIRPTPRTETNTPDKHAELTAYKITRTAIARSFKTKLRIERARMTPRYSHHRTRNFPRLRGPDSTLSPRCPRLCARSTTRRRPRCSKSRCSVNSCSRILLRIISSRNPNQHHQLVEHYFHFYSKLHKEKCRCSCQTLISNRLRG